MKVLVFDSAPSVRMLERYLLDHEVVGYHSLVDMKRAADSDSLPKVDVAVISDFEQTELEASQLLLRYRVRVAPNLKLIGWGAAPVSEERFGYQVDAYVEKGAPSKLRDLINRISSQPR